MNPLSVVCIEAASPLGWCSRVQTKLQGYGSHDGRCGERGRPGAVIGERGRSVDGWERCMSEDGLLTAGCVRWGQWQDFLAVARLISEVHLRMPALFKVFPRSRQTPQEIMQGGTALHVNDADVMPQKGKPSAPQGPQIQKISLETASPSGSNNHQHHFQANFKHILLAVLGT